MADFCKKERLKGGEKIANSNTAQASDAGGLVGIMER